MEYIADSMGIDYITKINIRCVSSIMRHANMSLDLAVYSAAYSTAYLARPLPPPHTQVILTRMH